MIFGVKHDQLVFLSCDSLIHRTLLMMRSRRGWVSKPSTSIAIASRTAKVSRPVTMKIGIRLILSDMFGSQEATEPQMNRNPNVFSCKR